MIEKEDLDGISNVTPDSQHAPVSIYAMQKGIAVLCEKPMASSLEEAEEMRRTAGENGVIGMVNYSKRSSSGLQYARELIRKGGIGRIMHVEASYLQSWLVTDEWGDWRVDPRFTWRLSTAHGSSGTLGDIGCHTFDAPFWALDLGLPTKVEVERKEPPGPGFISMGSVVTYHFPARGSKPPVTLKWYEKGYEVPTPKCWEKGKKLHGEGGMYMEGSKETLYHSGMRPTSPQILPNARYMEMKGELKKIDKLPSAGGGPIEEWFRAIKGGPMTGSNFDYAGPLTEMVLLGAMAQRSGKTIEWDAANMKVKGQPEFDAWIREPAREGWDFGTKL